MRFVYIRLKRSRSCGATFHQLQWLAFAFNTLDPSIPIAARRVWVLTPQYNVKLVDALILGNLFLDPGVELAYAD
jgi:hypothetical protein